MRLNPERRLAGILAPVFALRTEDDLGIGDTAAMRKMIDWCHQHGLNILQTLPINELSIDFSPYNAISSLAIEPATIAISPEHLPELTRADFREAATPELLSRLREGRVHYPEVTALKRALLRTAFDRFLKRHPDGSTERGRTFRQFRLDNQSWLEDYALFRALMEENGNSAAWSEWPQPHRSPREARAWVNSLPEQRRDALALRQLFAEYIQWVAFDQWQAVRDYAAAREVYLMGDVPYGIARCSGDVWANGKLFDLDWCGGAPPEKTFKVDPFTEKWGQNWNIPLYRWEEIRRNDFEWWRMRIGNLLRAFHLYRIDHALGFFRIYSFPWTSDRNAEFLALTPSEVADKTGGRLPGFKRFPDDTPEHRADNQRQGEEILGKLLDISGETTVIAEDLGLVPEYVPGTLQKLGMPGFRIPAFFRDHSGEYSDPKKYPRLSLAQPATHDHPPLAAVWAEHWAYMDSGRNFDDNRLELWRIMRFCGLGDQEPPRQFTDQVHEGYVRAVMGSNSWLAVFQITDVFAQTGRFNVPGSESPTNWSLRLDCPIEQFDKDPALAAKARMFSRAARESGRGARSF